MIISSRTPEGKPADCPICGNHVVVEPSIFFGDATCPHCGTLLWLLRVPGEQIVFDHQSSRVLREHLFDFLAEQLGVPRDQIDEKTTLTGIDGDSLDMVELVMELEEELRNN